MTAAHEDRTLADLAWLTDQMLSYGPLIPDALAVMLRAYKCALKQPETVGIFDPPLRYSEIAGLIEQRLKDGEWAPGTRMPPANTFARTYGAADRTVARAMHMLALKDMLAFERGPYYVTLRH
jgi:hypothetical protein